MVNLATYHGSYLHYEFYNLSFKIYENDFTIKNNILGSPLNDIFFANTSQREFEQGVVLKQIEAYL